jgi:uncharacterized protein YeeX (DUF496 family)
VVTFPLAFLPVTFTFSSTPTFVLLATLVVKLHKEGRPIRPIFNWRNSLGNKLATQLARQLINIIQLPNAFNIQNSEKRIYDLKKINMETNTKICFFDIKNIYANIPQNYLTCIINNILTNNTPDNQRREIITLIKVILNQNYLQHNNHHYTKN